MPPGNQQAILRDRLEEALPHFSERFLSFDLATSQIYSELVARIRAAVRAIGTVDSYIAATAAPNGLAIATRDTSPFEAAALKVIGPWST